jgi:hypothetical protein
LVHPDVAVGAVGPTLDVVGGIEEVVAVACGVVVGAEDVVAGGVVAAGVWVVLGDVVGGAVVVVVVAMTVCSLATRVLREWVARGELAGWD